MSLKSRYIFYRERFIRWLAREYITAEEERFRRYRLGCIEEAKKEQAETARFASLVARYSAALVTISRLRACTPASDVAYRALREHGEIGWDEVLRPRTQTLRGFIEMETGVKFSADGKACDSAKMLKARGATEGNGEPIRAIRNPA